LNHLSNCVSHCLGSCINVQEEGLTIDEIEKYFPGFRIFIDYRKGHQGQRTKEERRANYPDKKKKHTIKTQYIYENYISSHLNISIKKSQSIPRS
jgi:hypothetical protein